MNKKNTFALITGASSGIGLEIANSLAERGFNLILTARNEVKLIELSKKLSVKHGIKVDFVCSDLSQKESPQDIYNFCTSNNYHIDCLVNNAGYGIATPFHETAMDAEEDFIRVLGIAVIALSKLFLPNMISNRYGKIMIVSSVAAFAPPSTIQALYGPIKTFMNRFSDALNTNYNHKGITSTAVCPGFTVTNFHQSSGVQNEMDKVPAFMKFSARQIADEAVEATLNGKPLCVPTKTYRFLVFLLRILPSSALKLLESNLAPGRYDQK
ncbi:MAG: SDR family NAD(P)-dependent oxidoreductase [Gammaproteobacteria bacterium]|jgi:hypothetical protein|nr:SDR family NAD(P)-dependent oxidoreductase [Gammaproteobacteria bacterium]MBT6073943.1 SDR family NAD(P)-dependent oxidoreductase [Gammaproteobacteria bacterium]MBT7754500.1 SDR family NAD(P)-dependent oxidoreductase [Gammaproteobacteria bacterium]